MPHTTTHKILRKHLKFKSYKYQLLQHVSAKDKEVRYTFCSDVLLRLEDEILHPKLSSVMKPDSIYREMLINITFWGSNNHEVIEHTRDSPQL
jgi:hypothetical protein